MNLLSRQKSISRNNAYIHFTFPTFILFHFRYIFAKKSIRVTYQVISRYINIPAGVGGALMMGTIVWFINADHGVMPALVAALKQAAYTFLVAGLFIRLLEYLVCRIKQKTLALVVSVLVTSLLTIGLVYIVHSLRGTPKPFYSTLATIVLSPFGYLGLAIRSRRLAEKNRR